MKHFFVITLVLACLIAGAIAQEPQTQFLSPVVTGQQAFASLDQAQLVSDDEEESEVRNKRQFGFGGGYGRGGGGYGRRGFGGGGYGRRGFGGGGYGRRGFGGGGFGGGYGR